MGRTARDNRPNLKPVQRIELSEGNVKARIIAVIVFALLGIGTIAYAMFSMLGSKSGWETIEANNGSLGDISKEFVFTYRLGAADMSPVAEKKALTTLYTNLTRKAYQIFLANERYNDVTGLYALNVNPNTELTIDPALYKALQTVTADGSRVIYLAPLYSQYAAVFYSREDAEAAEYDPMKNAELTEEVQTLLGYVNDPTSVDLTFLGENRVCLKVSDEYKTYLSENWGTDYLDFGWMRNAFIADYVADGLLAAGYQNGVLTSCDGFVRNMYAGKEKGSFSVYHRNGNVVKQEFSMEFDDARSYVFLHDYPLGVLESEHYYEYADGTIRCPYVDPADGNAKAVVDTFIAYAPQSQGLCCSELLMHAIKAYVTDDLNTAALAEMGAQNINYLFFLKNQIVTNDETLSK